MRSLSRIDDIAERARAEGLRPWIAVKERIAEVVVTAMGRTEGAVLQGGAALRFAYGSPRLSADVDFVGIAVGTVLEAAGPGLAEAAGAALDCRATWSLSRRGKLLRGKVAIEQGAGRRLVLPVEAYEVPAHRVQSSPSAGTVEMPEEIVADKVVASADRLSRRGALKTTDLFDLWHLLARVGAPTPEVALVVQKMRDYEQPRRGAEPGSVARAFPPEELQAALEGVLPAAVLRTLPVREILDAAADVLDTFRDVL